MTDSTPATAATDEAVELVLRKHLPVKMGDDVICICDARLIFEGPVGQRLHVAEELRKAGLTHAWIAADKPLLDRLAGDQSKLYRLSWEMVDQRELWRYCNADPNYYSNTTQTVPNSQIPDEHWHSLSRMTDNPWQQFNKLREWADADREFVRNVRLEALSVTSEAVEDVTHNDA